MAGKKRKCLFHKDGVHRFFFYGRTGVCRCGHTLTKVSD